MGLGAQRSKVAVLVTFAEWARRNGYAVGEMPPYGTVHPVHAHGSWHYDREGRYGKACDINHNQSAERAYLITATQVAMDLGLGVIFAWHGTNGPCKNHQTHLHVDVGPYSNIGSGPFTPAGQDSKTIGIQAATGAARDQVWGPDTDRRVEAVRAASRWRGHTFPGGVAYVQAVVGTKTDGSWGPASRRAHDHCVMAIQRALGVAADGSWGPHTDAAYLAARGVRKR